MSSCDQFPGGSRLVTLRLELIGLKRKPQNTGIPGSPRNFFTPASPSTAARVDHLRDRLTTYITLLLSFLLLLQSKNKLLGEASLCFLDHANEKSGKPLGMGVFVFVIFNDSRCFRVSWVFCFGMHY